MSKQLLANLDRYDYYLIGRGQITAKEEMQHGVKHDGCIVRIDKETEQVYTLDLKTGTWTKKGDPGQRSFDAGYLFR